MKANNSIIKSLVRLASVVLLMIMGVVEVWGTGSITPEITSKTINVDGETASGTFSFSVSGSGLTDYYGYLFVVTDPTTDDYVTYAWDCGFGSIGTYSTNSTSGTVYVSYELYEEGTYNCTVTVYGWEEDTYDYIYEDISVTITVKSSCKSRTLSFASSSINRDLGTTPAKFQNYTLSAGSGTVTWSSSNTSVATIDSSTGVVTTVSVGSTTIKASATSDGTNCAVEGSYTLNVKANPPTIAKSSLAVRDIGTSGATFSGGKATANGGKTITQYGYIVGTSSSVEWAGRLGAIGWASAPTLNEEWGEKTLSSGLTSGNTYYVRPFAYNGDKYGYGDAVSFTTLHVYEITLDKNTGSEDGLATVVENATSIDLEAPTKTGYNVEGYYTNAACTTKVATAAGALQPSVEVSSTAWTNSSSQWVKGGGATFVTNWAANTYKVVFNNNGGSGSMDDETGFSYGTSKALSTCTFTAPTHKYFIGWNTDKDATTALYTDGQSVSNLTSTNNGSVTLYAIWKEHTYKNYRTTCAIYDITLDDGLVATTNNGSATVSLNSKRIKNISAPTKTGYTVEGYYTTNGGSTKIADAEGNLQASIEVSSTAWTNSSKEWVLEDGTTFYASWTANTYDITLDNESPTEEGSTSVTLTYASNSHDAITNPTMTGYTFGGWYSGDNGTGELVIDANGDLLADVEVDEVDWTDGSGNWIYDEEGVTLYAKWTANSYTVTLDNNGATSGSQQTVSATYDAAMPLVTTADKTPAVVALSRTGYTFTGWWDAAEGGNQYYSYTGTPAAIASARTWDKTSTTTLKAQWSINSYTLTWNWGGGETSATSGEDYTAGGEVNYGTTISYPDDGTMSKTGYTFTGWSSTPSTMPASATTITAQWSINDYNISVLANSNVTITATPASGDAIAEGSNADANYNKTITLNYSSLGSGLTWGGWRVYKSGDKDTPVSVSGSGNGATFSLPAYDVKVEAIVYSAGIAWCEPDEITITGDVHLTSYANVPVNTTSGASNLINISCDDLGSATEIVVLYNDGSDDVEVASSLFHLSDASTYAAVDEEDIDVSESRALNQDYSIQYKPGADEFDNVDNWQLKLKFKKGDQVLGTTKTHNIYGRALPEEFVIAVKNTNDNKWYALPNDLNSSYSSQTIITPTQIFVDNTTTPTAATFASSATIYKGRARNNATGNVNGIRLTTTGSNSLSLVNDAKKLYLPTSNDDEKQVWYLKSSDFGAYEIAQDPSQSPTKKMGLYTYSGKDYFGYDAIANVHSSNIYLLPVTNKYSDIPATATDWTKDVLGVTAESADDVSAAKMAVMLEGGSPTSAVTLGTPATDTYVANFNDGIDFSSKNGQTLLLKWYNSSDKMVGGSMITMPSIVLAGSNDEWSDFTSDPTINDIVILTQPMAVDETAKAKRIVIDKSGSNTGKLTVNAGEGLVIAETIKKYNGTGFVATEEEDIKLLSDGTNGTGALAVGEESTDTKATVQFYTKANANDGWVNQYFGIPVEETSGLAYYGAYLYEFDAEAFRWNNITSEKLQAFHPYRILRREKTTTTFEIGGTLVLPGTTTHKDKVLDLFRDKADYKEIDPSTEKPYNTINIYSNSWAAPIAITAFEDGDFVNVEKTIYIFNAGTVAQAATQSSFGAKDDTPGQWLSLPISTVKDNPSNYLTVIPSQQAFLVYATGKPDEEDGHHLKLDYKKLVYDPAVAGTAAIVPNRAPRREAEEEMEMMCLKVEGESGYRDRVMIHMRSDFSQGFDNGWDGSKIEGNATAPQMYAITEGGYMSVNCVPTAEGTVIAFKTGSEDSNYNFTFDYDGEEVWYLNDLQEQESTMIDAAHSYQFSSTTNDDKARFVISKSPIHKVTTGVEGTGNDPEVHKLLIEDKLFIIRGGHMYSADGALVK